jgi:hypothetical protein
MLGVAGGGMAMLPLHCTTYHSWSPAVVAMLLARGPGKAARAKTVRGHTPVDFADNWNKGPGMEDIKALLRDALLGYAPRRVGVPMRAALGRGPAARGSGAGCVARAERQLAEAFGRTIMVPNPLGPLHRGSVSGIDPPPNSGAPPPPPPGPRT